MSVDGDGGPRELVLFRDEDIYHFIVNGFVTVQPSALPAAFHADTKEELEAVLAEEGNPPGCNNLLPRMPMRCYAPRDRISQLWIVIFRFISKFSTCVSAVQYSNVGQ